MKSSREDVSLNQRAVAKKAGVSSATVSRVINGSPAVREETAKHVRRILEELNFIPNPIATTLKYGRSNTYGVIIPDLTNPFFPEFLRNFEEALIERDHELLMATTEASEPKLVNSVRRMLMRRVDGVVLMASEFDTRSIEPLLDHKIPIVTVDRRHVEQGAGDVSIDFEDGYRKAVVHLRELGHERIGFVGGIPGIRTSEVRLEAFRQALEFAGLEYDPQLMRSSDYRVAGGDAAMRSLLKESHLPTAIVTVNDLSAFGVLRALHACGVAVPGEMSVVGFDGILLSDAMYPPLTTIRVSSLDLAQACIKALDHSKANITRRGLELSVRGRLIVRESTGRTAPRNRTRGFAKSGV
jgi:LacI family transcriptional regulator